MLQQSSHELFFSSLGILMETARKLRVQICLQEGPQPQMQVGLGGLHLIQFWGTVTCNSPCMQGSQLYISSLAVLNKIFAV